MPFQNKSVNEQAFPEEDDSSLFNLDEERYDAIIDDSLVASISNYEDSSLTPEEQTSPRSCPSPLFDGPITIWASIGQEIKRLWDKPSPCNPMAWEVNDDFCPVLKKRLRSYESFIPKYSTKVLASGIPNCLNIVDLVKIFQPFGLINIDCSATSTIGLFKVAGANAAYLIFRRFSDVENLVSKCIFNSFSEEFSFPIHYRAVGKRYIKLFPWLCRHATFVEKGIHSMDDKKKVFFEGGNGAFTSRGLAKTFTDAFGQVACCNLTSAGRHHGYYATGSGFIIFTTTQSCAKAFAAGHVIHRAGTINFAVTIHKKPPPLCSNCSSSKSLCCCGPNPQRNSNAAKEM